MKYASRRRVRATRLSLALVAVLAISACGGGATQAPANGPDATPPPGSTATPSRPTEPAATAGPGDGSEAFAAASTALDALDSYAFRVEIQTTSSHTVLSGVVVNRPDKASSLEQADLDKSGLPSNESGIVIIGADAWLRSGAATEAWTALPAASAEVFIQSMAAFRPEQMFGLYFAGIGGSFAAGGTETKNGIESVHYTGDESVGAILGTLAGVQGTWSSDVWIAKDGGFLVHSEAKAESTAGGSLDSFLIVVDITDPNSAGPIKPPS